MGYLQHLSKADISRLVATLVVAFGIFFVAGSVYFLAKNMSRPIVVKLDAKPLNIMLDERPWVSPDAASNPLIDFVATELFGAIRQAREEAVEVALTPAELSRLAAEKFVDGLGGEAGKRSAVRLDNLFGYLIDLKAEPLSPTPESKQQLAAILIREVIEVTPSLPIDRDSPTLPSETITFTNNRATLDPNAWVTLRKVREAVENYPGAIVLITSTTDTVGAKDHNLQLSLARATAVREALISPHGLDAASVFITWLADTGLPHPTPSNTSLEQNRSASIQIRLCF